jgi:hypothetical protein
MTATRNCKNGTSTEIIYADELFVYIETKQRLASRFLGSIQQPITMSRGMNRLHKCCIHVETLGATQVVSRDVSKVLRRISLRYMAIMTARVTMRSFNTRFKYIKAGVKFPYFPLQLAFNVIWILSFVILQGPKEEKNHKKTALSGQLHSD